MRAETQATIEAIRKSLKLLGQRMDWETAPHRLEELNAMIEADRLESLAGTPTMVNTPSESGLGQKIARCPHCQVAVWSHYAGAGPVMAFVRVGTLDAPDHLPPDIHIFTASKQPWVVLPPGTPAVAEYYEREGLWPAQSIARRQALLPRIQAYRAAAGLDPV